MKGIAIALSLFISPPVWAGEIILRLPDNVLTTKVREKCLWIHCESDTDGGYKTPQEQAQWILDKVVQPIVDAAIRTESRGRDTFESLGAELDVRFEAEEMEEACKKCLGLPDDYLPPYRLEPNN